MNIYVINLENSVDRWEKISADLSNQNANFERISAIYGKSIDWQSASDSKYCRSYMGRSIQPGEVGCFLSHVAAIQKFVASKEDFVIILEDDAQISANFIVAVEEVLARMRNTDFYAINLGPSDYKFTSLVEKFESHQIFCAHRFPMLATGILWSKNGAKAFLDQYKLASLPYDNYLRVFLTGTNKAYSIKPSIVSPADFASDIDAEGITKKRSLLNRSKFYFFIKQKRMLFEKFRACLSMLKFKYSRN